MQYLDEQERVQKKRELDEHYKKMQSWSIREGKALRWLKDIPRDAVILEVGTGSGFFASRAREEGFTNMYHTDIEDYVVYPDVRSGGRFFKADLSFDKLPFDDAFFDVIIVLQVLEHVENPWHAVREFQRLLKKDGLCIVTIPRADALAYRWSYLLYKTPDRRHMPVNNDVNFFIPDLVNRLFGKGWHREWTDYSTSFVRVFGRFKIRFPDIYWINKIFANRIGFGFKKV